MSTRSSHGEMLCREVSGHHADLRRPNTRSQFLRYFEFPILARRYVNKIADEPDTRACCTAGSMREIKIAMMAITTSSSISVKPRSLRVSPDTDGRAARLFNFVSHQVRTGNGPASRNHEALKRSRCLLE